MRLILWLLFYLMLLGYPSIDVRYVDGLEIKLKGWERLFRKDKS